MTHDPARTGIVAGGTGGVWRVLTDDGELLDASLRGRLKKADVGRRAGGSIRRDTVATAAEVVKLAVGDRVRLERDARDQAWAIGEILPRTSRLARRAPGGGRGERTIAANVDQVVIVFAAARPDPHPRMLDRFLVIAEANGLAARIVINKVDLVDAAEAHTRFGDYATAGYPVHFASVKRGDGLEALLHALAGRLSVLTGPSGVGKSSLLNALFPGLSLRVGEISASVNKGRHTTVGASLHPLPPPATGYVVDTPGLREVGMWELPVDRLDHCFPEFRPYHDRCRFADCAHDREPECAVRAAVERGDVSAARYESYLLLAQELRDARPAWD
ncbi:MAG TPA: ribosome small subunit-dependent GTPase A [Gemmatimonadaceae bacterium]|nr:ribosome small subunit-dependent GTPase A [Gemmatimonadaceae bacterium]